MDVVNQVQTENVSFHLFCFAFSPGACVRDVRDVRDVFAPCSVAVRRGFMSVFVPVKRLCVGPRHGGTCTGTENRIGITVRMWLRSWSWFWFWWFHSDTQMLVRPASLGFIAVFALSGGGRDAGLRAAGV